MEVKKGLHYRIIVLTIILISVLFFQAFPLDMSQFGNLFNSTRIPEVGKDSLRCDPKAQHMLIMKNGHFYVFDVFDKDGMCFSRLYIYTIQ